MGPAVGADGRPHPGSGRSWSRSVRPSRCHRVHLVAQALRCYCNPAWNSYRRTPVTTHVWPTARGIVHPWPRWSVRRKEA